MTWYGLVLGIFTFLRFLPETLYRLWDVASLTHAQRNGRTSRIYLQISKAETQGWFTQVNTTVIPKDIYTVGEVPKPLMVYSPTTTQTRTPTHTLQIHLPRRRITRASKQKKGR